MSETITRCAFGDKEYILVGTAHVSAESVVEVREAITGESPERVCVELDEGRYRSLSDQQGWQNLDIFKVLRQGKGFLLMANLLLASFQKRLGLETQMKPGEEMKAAVTVSQENNIPFSLVDREISVTLRRAWSCSGFRGKLKLISALLSSGFGDEKIEAAEIEKLKQKSELEGMLDALAEELPKAKEVLIDERDRFLASRLYECSENKILAVVGAGHVPGMQRWLEDLHAGRRTSDTTDISSVPGKSLFSKVFPWVLAGAIVGIFVAAFLLKGGSTFSTMLWAWVIATGGCAGLGALLSLAHPLSVLTAVVMAPLKPIHPFASSGLFAGLVETWVRKPRVKDMENLQTDATTFKGFFKNRVTRILLVLITTSIGSGIGLWIGVPLLVRYLAA